MRRSTPVRDEPARQAGAARSPRRERLDRRGDLVGDDDKRHRLRAGDMLILVRQRGALFEAVIRALKNAGIAGRRRRPADADRAHRGDGPDGAGRRAAAAGGRSRAGDGAEEPAVRPRPRTSCSTLACGPQGQRCDAALRTQAAAIIAARARRAARTVARALTPFAFYAGLLGAERRPQAVPGAARPRGRRRARRIPQPRARLRAPRDAVAAGLRRLAAPAAGRGQARHGNGARRGAGDDRARRQGPGGADRDPGRHHDAAAGPRIQPRLLHCLPDAAPARRRSPGLGRAKADDVGRWPRRATRRSTKRDDEYRRLLYVAMTRAADRLIVCGVDGDDKRAGGLLVRSRRAARSKRPAADRRAGRRRRRRRAALSQGADDAAGRRDRRREPTGDADRAPGLAAATSPPSRRAPRRSRRRGFVDDADRRCSVRPRDARQRAIAARQYRAPADAVAARHSAGARAPTPRGAIIARQRRISTTPSATRSSQQVLARSRRSALCRAVRAGQPRRGADRRPRRRTAPSSGQVDRLVVTPDAVLIADYKTNRPAPRSLAETQARYRAMSTQLALYRAVLTQLYPDRPVRAALVWTDIPDLMEIPADSAGCGARQPHRRVMPP